jgi:acyl carrier protein
MNTASSINPGIRSFVLKTFPAARRRSIDDDTPLIGSGIIDSLGMLDVVAFLEESFLIKVSDDELTPDNFASINCMASFVEAKRSQNQVSVR